MTRTSVYTFVAIILAVFFGPSPEVYSLPDIDEQKDQIRKRDRELLQLEKKRRNIGEEESILIEELKGLEHRLRDLDIKIYNHTQLITQVKQHATYLEGIVNNSKNEIGRRMRITYIQGDAYYLSRAETVGDFLTRLNKLYRVMKQDRRMMSGFEENYGRLQIARRNLSTQLSTLEKEKECARKMLRLMQAQMVRTKQSRSIVATKIEHLEEENEKAQTTAFQLVQGSIEKARAHEIQKGTLTFTGGHFYWPVDGGSITSSFGYRFDPVQKVHRLHRGLDIGGAFGTPIKAAADGRVIESRPSNGYGYIVVLYHGNGISTLYAHMYGSTVSVKVGDFVHKGQVIALVGSNGWSTGPHLHFEVIEGGQAKNPIAYFERTVWR